MASGKGADSTKSTNFGLLWGSLHFSGPRSRKSRKIHRSLGNGFRKRSGLYKINKFWACGVPSISAVPEAGNPANPQGPWKWLPEKERALQNRQILGFCGIPSISAVPEGGNPRNPQGPWKWLPEKKRTLQNRQILCFCGVPSISAVPTAGNPGNPQKPWKWLPGKGADSTKSTNFGLLWGSLHFGGNPEIQEIHRGLRNGFRKRSGLYKIDKFWAFVVFPPFRRSQKPESQEIRKSLTSGKGADSAKSTNFGLLWGSLHSGGPRSRKFVNRQSRCLCEVPFISAATGDRKPRKSRVPSDIVGCDIFKKSLGPKP